MAVNQVTMTITSEASNVACVRRLAAQMGTFLAIEIDNDYLALLTTELVTNAVRVEAGDVTTTFTRIAGAIRVEVHDAGGGWPVMGHPQPLDENGGRGLLIVNALADAWGAHSSDEEGTTVWFEMSSPRPDPGREPAVHRQPGDGAPESDQGPPGTVVSSGAAGRVALS